jgi:hypothetical protein
MQLEKLANAGSYEFHRPDASGLIDPALARLLPVFPYAPPVQISICAGLPDKAKGVCTKEVVIDGRC